TRASSRPSRGNCAPIGAVRRTPADRGGPAPMRRRAQSQIVSSPPTATIVIPTRQRPAYLDVALASVQPQARAAGAEIVVVNDGGDQATIAVAHRHGARVVAPPSPGGLNAARNAGIDAA